MNEDGHDDEEKHRMMMMMSRSLMVADEHQPSSANMDNNLHMFFHPHAPNASAQWTYSSMAPSGWWPINTDVYAPNYSRSYKDDAAIMEIIGDGDGGGEYFNRSLCDKAYLSDNDLSSSYFQIAVYIMYISIFVVAMLGNGIVCYIVTSSPRMRTVTNYFIANLAVGDILMSLFCVPFSFVSILLLHYWPFGSVLCHLVNYSQAVSVLVSAYTLVAISIDRYIAIMWPLRPRITKR